MTAELLVAVLILGVFASSVLVNLIVQLRRSPAARLASLPRAVVRTRSES